MIENVHSHEGEGQGRNQASFLFKPPKNIKQIGENTSQKKIYVEDYVFTYMKELGKKEYASCRIAVLLGHYIKNQDSRIILINGAVEAEGIQYDSENVFNNDTWTNIYESIKRYFIDVEIVGWCIVGAGFILENEEKLRKIHLDNFAGVDKTLMKYDSLEAEESFYIYENGSLARQSGYYIYYEKNEDMQNYIMEHKPIESKSRREVENEVVKEYKEEVKEQKVQENNKSMMHLMYAAGSLMVVLVIAVFAAMINNGNKIHTLEESLTELSAVIYADGQIGDGQTQVAQATEETEQTLNVDTISGSLNSIKEEEVIGDYTQDETTEAEDQQKEQEDQASKEEETEDGAASDDTKKSEEISDSEDKNKEEVVENDQTDESEKVAEDTKKETDTEKTAEKTAEDSNSKSADSEDKTQEQQASSEDEAKEASASAAEVKYYEVEKGDTLVEISFKLYGSGDYVTEIMELNHIEDMDMIYYGQKLIVP